MDEKIPTANQLKLVIQAKNFLDNYDPQQRAKCRQEAIGLLAGVSALGLFTSPASAFIGGTLGLGINYVWKRTQQDTERIVNEARINLEKFQQKF